MKNYSVKNIILKTILFTIVLGTSVILFMFRESISVDIKNILNIKPKQYYGITVDMSQILPESQHYLINNKGQDLIDVAGSLGMNTLRIANITSPTDQKITPSYTHQQWKEVLDKMKKKGMYAEILVESTSQDTSYFTTEINDSYVDFVKHYVVDPDLCTFSNILAVDIRNEPLLDTNNLTKLKQAANLVKSSCPAMQITIGSWKLGENWHDPKGAAVLRDIVDLYAVHIYGFDKQKNKEYPDPYTLTTSYLHEIKKYSGNKPILIEEFGAGNGSAITDQHTLGSQSLQKQTYEGVLNASYAWRNRDVIGALAYVFHSRSDQADGWSIATNNGDTLLPAAYTFKEYTSK